MTETPATAPKKTRRSPDQIKAHLLAQAAAIDAKKDLRHKIELMRIGEALKAIADARPAEKHLAASAAQIIGWATAIKAEIPQ